MPICRSAQLIMSRIKATSMPTSAQQQRKIRGAHDLKQPHLQQHEREVPEAPSAEGTRPAPRPDDCARKSALPRSVPRRETPRSPVTGYESPVICVSSSQPEEQADTVIDPLLGFSELLDEYGRAVFTCSSESLACSQAPGLDEPVSRIIEAKQQVVNHFKASHAVTTDRIAELQFVADQANTSAKEKGTEVDQLARENKRLEQRLIAEQVIVSRLREERNKAVKGEQEASAKYVEMIRKHEKAKKRAREMFEKSMESGKKVKTE